MILLLISIGIILLSGCIALALSGRPLFSAGLGAAGNVLAAVPGLYLCMETLLTGQPLSMQIPWAMPYGSFVVEIDALSALFLIPIFVLSALTALYGVRYLTAHPEGKSPGLAAFFFNLLVAAMVAVVIARNAMLFLIAWEVMSLASFFLVTFYDDRSEVRQAGFTYLVATHIGTAFLFALFIFMGMQAGSLDFAAFQAAPTGASFNASLLFVLALIGFGTKAGLMPLHVWLPEAHPAAPSHVSALMSGVMIKTGIYGIVRTLTLLPETQGWWGWLLVIIGAASGILGVLFAIAQHDIKRLLAYHSVENIGIITIGLGLGVLGIHYHSPVLAVAGFAGALLHVVNHALFKGLLFLGAGAVIQASGTRDIDRFGGLIRRMPWTAGAFLIGSISICGIPPFNGFISEFMVYYGAFQGTTTGANGIFVPSVLSIGSLAVIGGLALACFTKSFGITFLGEPRTESAAQAHEVAPSMRLAMWILAGACVLIGLCSPLVIPALETAVSGIARMPGTNTAARLTDMATLMTCFIQAMVVLAGLIALLLWLRRSLLQQRKVDRQVTWDCGYAEPSPRMQYTGASFAEPLVTLTRALLRTHASGSGPAGPFPKPVSYETHTPDIFFAYFFKPLFSGTDRLLGKLRWLQHGSIQIYILYIAATLMILMLWKLW